MSSLQFLHIMLKIFDGKTFVNEILKDLEDIFINFIDLYVKINLNF